MAEVVGAWQSMAKVGCAWQRSMAEVGCACRRLLVQGRAWQSMAEVGCAWQRLVELGSPWQGLDVHGGG